MSEILLSLSPTRKLTFSTGLVAQIAQAEVAPAGVQVGCGVPTPKQKLVCQEEYQMADFSHE